jgi:hypothetical protein
VQLAGKTVEWTRELRSAWSRFIIALHLRHPDAMPELRAATRAIWDSTGEDADRQRQYEGLRKLGAPETFEEYLQQRDPLISVKARINLITRVFDNEVFGTHVNTMHWDVIDVSNAPHRLLTSDRPVEIVRVKEPRGVISLPISPTKLFVAVNDLRVLDEVRRAKPRIIVSNSNKFVATRARRFVWAQDESQAPYVRKYMSTNLEPKPFFPSLSKY